MDTQEKIDEARRISDKANQRIDQLMDYYSFGFTMSFFKKLDALTKVIVAQEARIVRLTDQL